MVRRLSVGRPEEVSGLQLDWPHQPVGNREAPAHQLPCRFLSPFPPALQGEALHLVEDFVLCDQRHRHRFLSGVPSPKSPRIVAAAPLPGDTRRPIGAIGGTSMRLTTWTSVHVTTIRSPIEDP